MGVKIFFFNGTSMKKMIVNFVKPLWGLAYDIYRGYLYATYNEVVIKAYPQHFGYEQPWVCI